MTDQTKRITIDAPSEIVILAARHLDATEGPVQVGRLVDSATRSAITTVLRYVAKAHNTPQAAPAEHTPGPVNADDCPGCVAAAIERAERAEAAITRVRDLATQFRDHSAAGLDDYQIGRHDMAVDILTALDQPAPALAGTEETERP